jgi:hypothetical protein
MRRSALEFELDQDLVNAREQFLDDLGSPIARSGFGPKDFADSYLIFERRYIPWFAIVLAVLLFPIGLLFLLIKNTATLFVEFGEESARTHIKVDGQASKRVWTLIRDWGTART